MKILIDTPILNLLVHPTLTVHPIWKRQSSCLSSVQQKSVDILTKGWRRQTVKRYKPYFEKFYCERNKDPIRPDLNDTIEFLISVFHTGVGYSSINTARSALSALIEPINGLTLGKQPIIQRHMKGLFNIRPSLPKYTTTWNSDIVLNYFDSIPVNDDLTLKQLSHKLATLLRLHSGQRDQTISKLSINHMALTDDKCSFYIPAILKTTWSVIINHLLSL